jgi:hypothetical protein
MIQNIRDKLTSRRRNEDALFHELDHLLEIRGSLITARLDKQKVIENKIASLETKT